jgi:hypothetical protein
MALTLTYSVTSLKVKDEVNSEGATLTNAVCQTYWKVVGTDADGATGEFSGATPFTAANVPAGEFKDFADLEEQDVISWIQAVVEGDAAYKAHIVGRIQAQIDAEKVRETAMPWATDVTPVPPVPTPGV